MRKDILPIVLMAAFSVCAAFTIHKASLGHGIVAILPFSVATWLSYVASHYILNGKITDLKVSEDKTVELSDFDFPVLAGIAMMLASFPLGALGIRNVSFVFLLTSQLFFVYGYMTAHFGVTGNLL